MTIPETIVPTNPDNNIIISTTVNDVILENVLEIACAGFVKYSLSELSPTINEMTKGYKNAINQVRLNNIFKIKAMPKNITKYNNTDTIS